jgi:hypothetical protein
MIGVNMLSVALIVAKMLPQQHCSEKQDTTAWLCTTVPAPKKNRLLLVIGLYRIFF